jgi:zinc and cadmium transporter
MSAALQVFLLVTFGSMLSLVAGVLLLAKQELFRRLNLYLVAFAAGALIGTALFNLIPEALEHAEETLLNGETAPLFVAIGIVIFFLFEKFFHWYHDHAGHGHEHHGVTKSVVPLITVGDGFHNFLDGVLIAATTLTDPALGVATAIAVFLHEIPQEVGDFSVLIFGGLSRAKAILYNLGSAATAYLGALVTFVAAEQIESLTVPLVAVTAGAFIFIALSELVPELVHKEKSGVKTTLLALTFVIAIFFIRYLGKLIGVGH